jgi:DNA-binding LacI/PurR family transcriptional regulator/biotin operon repressor
MRRRIAGQTVFAYVRKRLGPFIEVLRNRGGFLPSEKALCAELGVSRNALKSAIDSMAAEGVLEVRPRKGNYVKQVTPLRFRAGLVVGMGRMPFFSDSRARVIAGAIDVFADADRTGIHQMHPADPEDILELARQYALDGVLWLDPAPDGMSALAQLRAAQIPAMVALTSFAKTPFSSNYAGLDHRGSGRAKAAHLLSRGCRKIAYLQGVDVEAGDAFRAELARAGVGAGDRRFMPDVEAMKERLPALLRNHDLDAIASDGGAERVETLFAILNEHRGPKPDLVVDYLPTLSRKHFAEARNRTLFLNVMPTREIGVRAAECLLKAKGRRAWEVRPLLIPPQIVPGEEILPIGQKGR